MMTTRTNSSIHHDRGGKVLFAALIFFAAYFTTVTVNAQEVREGIQLSKDSPAAVTGTIVSADNQYAIIDVAGREMRIDLSDIEMKTEADDIFKPGMEVNVSGDMRGENFGVPVLKARTITATQDVAPIR